MPIDPNSVKWDAPSGLGALAPEQRRKLRYDAPELDAYADEINDRYGLPPGLIRALKNAGERSNSWQVSPVGARGVMQFMPSNIQKYGVVDAEDPYELIDAAGRYLRDTSRQYGGNVEAMIADYNGGPRQARRVLRGERPAAAETDAYLTRVRGYLGGGGGGGGGGAIDPSTVAWDAPLDSSSIKWDEPGQAAPDFSNVTVETNMAGGASPRTPAPALQMPVAEMRAYEPSLWDAISDAGRTLIGRNEGSFERPLIARIEDAGGQLIDAITPDALQRGIAMGRRDLTQTMPFVPSVFGPEADAFRDEVAAAAQARQAQRFSASPDIEATKQAMSGAGSVGDWLSAVGDNPSAILDIVGESMGRQSLPLVTNAITPFLGVPATAASSFNTERLSAIDEVMQNAGVDLSDPVAVSAFKRANPEIVAQAEQRGMDRGAVIAPLDALSAGIAGRMVRGTGLGSAVKRTVTDAAVGTGGGMAGEAGAQVYADGGVTSLGDILTEGLAEGPGTIVEGATNALNARSVRPAAQAAPPADAFLGAPTEAPAPAAEPAAQVAEPAVETAQPAEQAQPAAPAQPQVARAEAQPTQPDQPASPAQEEVMQNDPGQIPDQRPVAPPVAESQVTGEMQNATEAPVESAPPVADPVQVDGRQGAKAFTATVEGKGDITLVDGLAPDGADFSEFGEVRQINAFDGDQKIATLVYANDGTPPTVEVDETYRRRGIATAMYALARKQGGVLGEARGGIRGRGAEYRTPMGQAFRQNADEGKVSLRPYAPPVGNANIPTNGQSTAPVEMTVPQVEQSQAAPAPTPDAPMQDISDDRRNFPDERQAGPSGSQSAPPRAAAELEATGEGPVETSQRGRGASEDFMRASFTNRRSWSQKAFRDAGLDPDAAELLPIDKQFEAVAKVSVDKYGMRVQKSDKALGRMAVDSATDLYRNAETMAHVLGLPAKAIGLGDSLTVLFRDGTPYLGAMYPKGGKVEGVDLPPGAIALPRRSNSFAHEWGHALDLHLVSKYGLTGDNLVSRQIRDQGIDFQPNSSKEAFAKLMNAMFFDDAALAARVSALQQMADSGTPNQQASAKRALQAIASGNNKLKVEGTRYVIDSRGFGSDVGGKSGARYFGDPAEMLARAFEAYVAEKVEASGGDVSVLAKGDRAYLSMDDSRFAKTFPKLYERIKIFAAFDDLFYQLGKEQLIASGVPAANPGNLDAFDPRVWLGDVERPAEYKGIKGALREQADQWNSAREQARRERDRPADPMTRWQRVQNAAMPLVSPIQSAFRVMERRYPKSAAVRELANSLVTDPGADRVVGRVLEQAIRITGGRNYNQFGNIIARYSLDKLDDAGRAQLRRLLISAEDATKAKPELVKAASELRRFMDAMWYDNQEAGINIGYTKNGYLPRVVDMANVIADPEGFIEAATKAYKAKLSQDETIDPGELDERAEAAARAWHFNLVNAPSMNFGTKTPAENYTKHRSLGPEADTLLEAFYVSDPLEVIHRYIGMSAKNTEFAKLFGEKGEKLNQLFEQMGAEGVSKEDQLYMQGMVENLLGRAPSMLDKKPRMAALMNQVNAYGVMSMLGRVLVSSIAEPGMAGIRTGNAANVYRPYWNLFKQSIGSADMKQWREITKAIGLIGDAQADMVIQARLGGTFESTPKTDARLARYFSITGLHALTNAQRVSLMPIAHRYLGSLSDQLDGKPAQAKEARALLAELGVNDPDAFARWMDDGRPPSIDELFDANGRETEQGAVYMTAMSRINEQIVQAPYRFDRPEMANTPVGRFLYGIMSFNLAFWNNVYKRQAKVIYRQFGDLNSGLSLKGVVSEARAGGVSAGAKEAARQLKQLEVGRVSKGAAVGSAKAGAYIGGHLAPPVLAYFFTQMLVTAAREALLNPQRWEEWDRDDTTNENLFLLTLSRAFPAGMFDIPIQAYQGLKYQRDLTGIAVGAVPSYFLGNMQKIVQVFQESNKDSSNNAEFAGMQGAYQVVANPLIAHLLTSAPGGRIMDPIYGLGLAYGTSAAARDQVATAVVGERDSLRKKRERDARRAAEVESGGRGSARGAVRNDDRRENAR